MDKLTEPVSIKFSPDMKEVVYSLASSQGLSASDYIRELVERDIQAHQERFLSYAKIFGNPERNDKE